MTGWFDPGVMARTAAMLAAANIFGRHSDTRLIEALGNQPQGIVDYSTATGDFWIDFVADIGDGWNPTYAIAQALAQPQLQLDAADGSSVLTSSGNVLVFGGDEVYPYPSRDRYAQNTEAPYVAAFAGAASRPDLFAIPGNHDWFDSLIAFSRSFCRPERGFAGCRTRQTRSYFALRLPQDWWLLGIDLQLGADLDEPQVHFFQTVARELDEQSKIILCVPEPHWIYECAYPNHPSYQARTLTYFEREVLGRPVRVFLTGDLHYYKRHADASGVQKIVAGGGGAFLHPTHRPDTTILREGFEEQASYPLPTQSARLAWRNLLFPVLNPRAALLPAIVYALSAWFASARLALADIETFPVALHSALNVAVRDPFCGLWLLFVIGGLVFFTDTHSRWYRLLGGGLHAVAHLFAALLVAWAAMRFTVMLLHLTYGQPLQLLAAGLLTFIGGAIVGSLLIGVYLLVSVGVFGRHYQEAFSSLRIQDFKSWLRLRITASGALEAWAIGIDRVPRRWRREQRGATDTWLADDGRATAPRVVDYFSGRR
ncbi:MAG TPA: hypothetical protein VGO41_04170 [Steroidobacteraceae bacterium]|nr:hypothetical protein [Steroidobacteraceae bacterium]